MYTYDMFLSKAREDGVVTEQKMWMAACKASKYMGMAQEGKLTNDEYWKFMREQHELFYGPHYDEEFAKYDLSKISYRGKSRDLRTGEYWSMAQIQEATSGMAFPKGTTDWDKYVAFNVAYSMLFNDFEDGDIIKAGYRIFFGTSDGVEGRIWLHMQPISKV